MPRKPADFRISLKKRGGTTHRIELIRQLGRNGFMVRKDGRISEELPEASATEIADRIRRWLVGADG